MGMILTGRRVPAAEGQTLGFVNEVVPAGHAVDGAKRWAAHATGERTAIITHHADAPAEQHSFAQLQSAANALSHVLAQHGVQAGDRVAVVLPQRFETAVAYMALWQMGAVVMPLSQLFGPEALVYRLQDAQAVLALVDRSLLVHRMQHGALMPLLVMALVSLLLVPLSTHRLPTLPAALP
jgi:acyl-coenzyme A synthetase/AMP-(fatty) acid ligase